MTTTTSSGQDIANYLQSHDIYVDKSIESTINAKQLAHAQKTIDGLDFPVHVAIVADGDYNADHDLFDQIKVFHGGDGAFVLVTTGDSVDLITDVRIPGDHDTELLLKQQYVNAMDTASYGTPAMTKLNVLLGFYANPKAPKERSYDQHPGHTGGTGTAVEAGGNFLTQAPVLSSSVIIAVVLVVAGLILAARSRRRRRRNADFTLPAAMLERVDSLQRDSLRESIQEDTSALARRLDALSTESLAPDQAAHVSRALDAYQMARAIVDDGASARIDLAGAMVLLNQAGREIAETRATKRERRKSSVVLPKNLCAINPLHGRATSTASVTTGAKGGETTAVNVPVCANCLKDVNRGNRLQWIYEGDQPYFMTKTVWARTLFGAIGGDLVTALQKEKPHLHRRE